MRKKRKEAEQQYLTHIKPYLETHDKELRNKAIEVSCKIFDDFIRAYCPQRLYKLSRFSVKTSLEDIKATCVYSVVVHIDQAKPCDFLMYCKYMITWIRKEVSNHCHFEETILTTYSDVVEDDNIFEVGDNFSTEKEALFNEIFGMMREVIEALPPKLRDSVEAAYVKEFSAADMTKRLPYYRSAISYLLSLKNSIPIIRELIIEKFGEKGLAEMEEFFLEEDF